jgi:hypothetical protein
MLKRSKPESESRKGVRSGSRGGSMENWSQRFYWIEIHRDDLLADWELAVHGKKPFNIKGLDQ